MAMTVSMARALGLSKLAVPTQGNAGDSLADYAVAAGIEAAIVMSPDTDRAGPRAMSRHWRSSIPEHVSLELVAGTIIDCGGRVREHYVPQGFFSVATFQEPGWRTEGKKTLGLEMAEPSGDRLTTRTWSVPDVIVYPTGGGTGRGRDGQGVRRAGGARAGRPGAAENGLRPEHGDAPRSSGRSRPATLDITPREPRARPSRPGLNVAKNVGHINVLRIIRETGGCAVAVSDGAIREVIREEWQIAASPGRPKERRPWPHSRNWPTCGVIREGDRVVLVNTASPEKYLPTIRELFDGGL